ncbi:MAG: ComEA family DNA-binding protein [Patiriisocius sp.]|uniref:ComEA family DNA-binding protein n=1 Tax=Patiriisocius sp. TaxID=2822396 RepID=UPI003EF3FE53
MKNFKSHFEYSKNERSGIFILCSIIVGLLVFLKFYKPTQVPLLDISSPEIVSSQNEIDSLKLIAIEARKPKIYPFNPNFITDYKAYTLGLSTEEFDRLKNFREKDKWVNSVSDFKKVTKVNDSVLYKISPYFKFPDWVTNPKSKYVSNTSFPKKNFKDYNKELPFEQKIDLNIATAEQLKKVYGIGDALSARIVKEREKLGGFSNNDQLYGIWGLNDSVVQKTLLQFTVKTPKVIEKINVNTASASDIATIKGISFDLAAEIWEFRTLRERINSLDELQKIDGITSSKLKLIALYLSVE